MLNFKGVSFVNTSTSFVWKYTALGESLVTNVALTLPHALFATQCSPQVTYFIQTSCSALSNSYVAT